MSFKYLAVNNEIEPIEKGVVSLSDIEYSYGYGVYETLRYSDGCIYFIDSHIDRLMNSADILELEHPFTKDQIISSCYELIKANGPTSCNLKITLIGGHDKSSAQIYILCLNPLFIDRKLYRDGVYCISTTFTRYLPKAKSLNMLPSYLNYKKARSEGAYEVLFKDEKGNFYEGSRSNLFAIKDGKLISPPSELILDGVTRDQLLIVCNKAGIEVLERDLSSDFLDTADSVFLTSTSAKLLPISKIENKEIPLGNELLKKLTSLFDQHLENHKLEHSRD